MENKYFAEALSNFTHDMASGGAIRHLADKGYTVDEIAERLDFPTPVEKIREMVWKHYLNTGVIQLEDPTQAKAEKVTYVKEYNSYGKASFRRVVESCEKTERRYIACDFGKRRYQDTIKFEQLLDRLDPRDKAYIMGLPWPLQTVYHVADERMERIYRNINGDCEKE